VRKLADEMKRHNKGFGKREPLSGRNAVGLKRQKGRGSLRGLRQYPDL